jgi:hypothetical protein
LQHDVTGFASNAAEKEGLIVNISSMISLIPAPLNSLYAASKAFVVKFSNEIRTEYQGHGIKVQTVIYWDSMGTFNEITWFSDPPRVRFDENEWLHEIFVGCAEPEEICPACFENRWRGESNHWVLCSCFDARRSSNFKLFGWSKELPSKSWADRGVPWSPRF